MWWMFRIGMLVGVILGLSSGMLWLVWCSLVLGLPFWLTSEGWYS